MEIARLIEIANSLEFTEISEELQEIKLRSNQDNCFLRIPLVGEFSSGKTTLINALTDNVKLETATMPTTATIYEVHFGEDHARVEVINEDGEISGIDDISAIGNEEFKEARAIEVYDTSDRIPSSIVLVDTPGLSSPNAKHKQTLVDFLPQADAILLVADINQQLTRSLTDFIQQTSLLNVPIYLILTKCDTKTSADIEEAKEYVSTNIHIPQSNIVCVSAKKDDLSQLYHLLNQLQSKKLDILKRINSQRVKKLAALMQGKIDELLASINDDPEMTMAVNRQGNKLEQLKRGIRNLIESMADDVKYKAKDASRYFENQVFDSLDALVANKSNNYDNDAVSAINTTCSLVLSRFKADVYSILRNKAASKSSSGEVIELPSLSKINLSDFEIPNLDYNINLNVLGHEYDSFISTGVKALGTVVVSKAVAAKGTIGGVLSNVLSQFTRGESVEEDTEEYKYKPQLEDLFDEEPFPVKDELSEQRLLIESPNHPNCESRGLVESMVGFFTDKMMGKPQRRKAIHSYIDCTLLPQFDNRILDLSTSISKRIEETLNNDAEEQVNTMTNILEDLKRKKEEKEEEYNQRISLLKKYKNELLNVK